MDPEPPRRTREPRGDLLPAVPERDPLSRLPGYADHRRGIDRLAAGVAADLPGGAWLRHEVEHGLDARHAALHDERSGVPQVSSRRADLQPVVRLPREFRPAALARRGGAR